MEKFDHRDCTGRKICPTQNVELLESPHGTWEVDAVADDNNTVYIISGPGTILCTGSQLRILPKS